MKLLLDMYKSAPKEQRDKVQLMAAEKKSKAEVHKPTHLICMPEPLSRSSSEMALLLLLMSTLSGRWTS